MSSDAKQNERTKFVDGAPPSAVTVSPHSAITISTVLSKKQFFVEINYLDLSLVRQLTSIIRTMKQTDSSIVVLVFNVKGSSAIIKEKKTFKERVEWSKEGQLLTKFISDSGLLFVSFIRSDCFNEYFELALACHKTFIIDSAKYGFIDDGENAYFPRWGSLAKLIQGVGISIYKSYLVNGSLDRLLSEYAKQFDFITSDKHFHDLLNNIRNLDLSISRLSILGMKNAFYYDTSEINALETNIYTSVFYKNKFEKIKYLNVEEIFDKLMVEKARKGKDDAQFDEILFKDMSPEKYISKIRKRRHIEKFDELFNKNDKNVNGKCIELGSGAGYFSILLSRLDNVVECIAFDISSASILRWGPAFWDFLSPNWEKLKYMIGDMNKLNEFEEYFDTVVFCGSLHHSNDIPQSLRVANNLLKKGGKVILFNEHYDALFFPYKNRRKGRIPHTIPQFTKLLKNAGFKPKVLRYNLRGQSFPLLKKIVFNYTPFHYLNGIIRLSNYVVIGVKNS